jgi:hypothetical protein
MSVQRPIPAAPLSGKGTDGPVGAQHGGGRFKRMLTKLTASRDEIEAAQLLEGATSGGGTPIGECVDRAQVTVYGTIRTVTLRPRAGVPALEAELYDGSGTVALVWLGRRQIAGIEPGRGMRVHGRLANSEGRPVIFNPRYELCPAGGQ